LFVAKITMTLVAMLDTKMQKINLGNSILFKLLWLEYIFQEGVTRETFGVCVFATLEMSANPNSVLCVEF
jgi:hypothetical protein